MSSERKQPFKTVPIFLYFVSWPRGSRSGYGFGFKLVPILECHEADASKFYMFWSDSNFEALKGVWHKIFDYKFFSWITSPRPLRIPLGPFQIFKKICGGTSMVRYHIHNLVFITSVNGTGDKLFKNPKLYNVILFSSFCSLHWSLSFIFSTFSCPG